MFDALDYPFFQRALAAGLLASIACGVIGTFVVVRRIASISGGLSHSAFGGIGLAYVVGFPPLLGAAGFGVLAALAIGIAYRRLREGFDTLIAIVWSVGMAVGVLLIALTPGYAPDLTTFLFGNILVVSPTHLYVAIGLDLMIVAIVGWQFTALRAVTFDEDFAQVVGVPVERVFLLLLTLTALAIVVLIRVVGIVLVIALLTLPASVARQWVRGLGPIILLGTVVSAGCTTAGLFTSYWLSAGLGINAPTGPIVVLLATALFAVSAMRRRPASG